MHYDHQFIDARGRKIEFDVREDWISAYHEGKKVGEFSLRIVEHEMLGDEVHADVIDLQEGFRSAGIGSEMVRLAFEMHGKIIPPATYYPEKENRNSMTPEGLRLMISCQKKGWVGPFPDQEPPPDCG
ncbi:hypothetical protein N2603_36445 [Bradyrhizobium huanghuaihaiense]|uniref:hypothetical protein n=1 Tax=Bradyrhizobium huanghuaihaiense TaxID=990078 RepID=UPI0021A97CF3|nr:hypothetical protein [Bradyrhizobium sp. CB3035]UWU75464.1 hypothetical protein N2603_36445 [Bradyrhizobium sp. CB3035]